LDGGGGGASEVGAKHQLAVPQITVIRPVVCAKAILAALRAAPADLDKQTDMTLRFRLRNSTPAQSHNTN
jgi:hypothetical protein